MVILKQEFGLDLKKCPHCGLDANFDKNKFDVIDRGGFLSINESKTAESFVVDFPFSLNDDKVRCSVLHCTFCNECIFVIYENAYPKPTYISHHPNRIHSSIKYSIKKYMPQFCEIYEQSLIAKANNLNHIVGLSLRKAAEFLVSDFLINVQKLELSDKSDFNERINLLDSDLPTACAHLLRIFGNDEAHIRNKKRVNVDEALLYMNVIIDKMDAYIIAKEANEKLQSLIKK